MRRRIFWNTLIISAVVLTIFGLIGTVAADMWYSRLTVAELKRYAAIILSDLPEAALLPEYAVKESKILSSGGNNVRVTLINPDGTVLGDSSADWRTMENHKGREEVAAAITNGWGSSQRYSETLKARMLYVAVYDGARQMAVRTAMPLIEIQNIYWVLGAFLLASLAASLGMAALLARRTARLLSQPVESLAGMTREIAAGNYDIRPLASGDPELKELSDGLVKLAHELSAEISALEKTNAQLSTVLASINDGLIAIDGEGRLLFVNNAATAMLSLGNADGLIGQKASIALPSKALCDLVAECLREHRTISREMQLSCAPLAQATVSPMRGAAPGCILLLVDITQLRKLENMRRDFVSNVTHELRTPLTSIRGYVEALQGGALGNPELSAKFLQIIDIESERLTNLIGDLLYLSEIENAGKDTGIRRFSLADVANGVVEMLSLTAAARKVKIDCGIGGDIYMEANPDRIKQLLLNLADNAVKYNREGGGVLISAEKTHGLARISVKDTGIGISEEHASRIFERFYRVDKGRSRSMGGTGLGLSIVKHIADLYHGNIRLISEAGKGSEFIIELPLKFEAKRRG